MTPRTAVRAVLVAAVALVALDATALDMHGYFRDSVSFNSKGGTQTCFALPGSYFKARLGNECERYLEIGFGEGGKFQNVEWRAEFMPASAQSFDSTANSNSLFIQQMWIGMKFLDWDGAQLWAGRRYWKRHDVHSIDFFYWNPAQGNAAVGLEDVNLGFGKFAATLIRIDANGIDTTVTGNPKSNLVYGTYMVPDLRVYGIPVITNGTLEVGVDLGIAMDHKVGVVPAGGGAPVQVDGLGADRAKTSPLFTAQWNQDKILGGGNTLAFQYGSGAFAKEAGDGPGQLIAGASSDDKQWRIIEHLVVNPVPEISGALVLMYQDISTAGTVDNGAKIFTAEVRPAYHFNDFFKLALDGFYQTLSVKNAAAGTPDSENLMKLTVAPTFVLGRGYWARPELRLFVTYASWNKNANAMGTIANGVFGTDTSGTTFGASIETWW